MRITNEIIVLDHYAVELWLARRIEMELADMVPQPSDIPRHQNRGANRCSVLAGREQQRLNSLGKRG